MPKFDRSLLVLNQERADEYMARLDDPTSKYLEHRGITADIGIKYRLGLADGLYDGRLSIPYVREPYGVIWINYRALNGETPKYMAHGRKHLYNTAALDHADQTGEIGICEGELDAIIATELCGVPSVGIPGATQWSGNKSWHELFTGYEKVWVLADPDEAGLGLATEIIDRIPAARLVNLPGDVTETVVVQGRNLREFIDGKN